MCPPVVRDDRGAAHRENVAVTSDHVADNGVASRTGNARAREHDFRSELASGDVQGAAGHCRRAAACCGEGPQPIGAEEHFAVDFELRVVRRVYGHAAEIAVPMMERAQRDKVPTLCFNDLEQRPANAHRLFIDRRHFRQDEGLCSRGRRRRHDVDHMRRGEVEIELQQGGKAAPHCQLVAV